MLRILLFAINLYCALCFLQNFKLNMKTSISKGMNCLPEKEVALNTLQESDELFESAPTQRVCCKRCKRPLRACICSSLPPSGELIDIPLNLVILQHPAEKKKKIVSSVPLIQLVLKRTTIINGFSFGPETNEFLGKILTTRPRPMLLFPLDDAETLTLDGEGSTADLCKLRDELKMSETNNNNNNVPVSPPTHSENMINSQVTSNVNFNDAYPTLILIDGTWQQARQIQLRSPQLIENCQVIKFELPTTSIIHNVRKEPKGHYCSTLEALCRTLTILEALDVLPHLKAKDNIDTVTDIGIDKNKDIYTDTDIVTKTEINREMELEIGGGIDTETRAKIKTTTHGIKDTRIREACHWLLASLQAMVNVQVEFGKLCPAVSRPQTEETEGGETLARKCTCECGRGW